MTDNDQKLRCASRNGHLETVKYLVEECKADPTAQNNTAVVYTSQNGHLETVKYLVEECKAYPTAQNNIAVIRASWNGHLETVKYLVEECKADPTARDNTAVVYASKNGHLETVKWLVDECEGVDSSLIKFDMWKTICDTKIQQFYKRQKLRKRLWKVLEQIIPLYYAPNAKGGFFAKKLIMDCLQ
jgi:ankyrin repeat protein